jgi:hypothetical protein
MASRSPDAYGTPRRFATTPSVPEGVASQASASAATPAGQWLIVAGSSSSQTRFAERRLPTRAELWGARHLTRHNPCIDTEFQPDTKSSSYWSSTPCAWNTSAFWVVSFYDGGVDGYLRSYGACVRAVRAGQ